MTNLQQLFAERKTHFEEIAATLRQKYLRFSLIRLFSFIAAIAIIILLWNVTGVASGIIGTILFIVGFGKFMQWHQRLSQTQKHHHYLSIINKNEGNCLNHQYSQFGDGHQYVDPQHPFSLDLDIFGPYSFFQYTNRTCRRNSCPSPAGRVQAKPSKPSHHGG